LTSTNSTYAYGDGSGWTFGGSGYVYFNQSGTTYSQTRIQARAGISNDQAADLTLYGGTSGYTTITGSARSPIFYDTDNTAYYLDPTGSTSLVAAGVLASFRSDTQEIIRTYNTSASSAAQFYIAHNYGAATIGNSRGTLDINSSYTTISNSTRSPIFYDSDNTGYYVNPADTSYVNVLNTAGTITSGGLIVTRTNYAAFNDSNDTTFSVRGNSSYGAVMSFHRAGAYAINVGLDTDNNFSIGGWSASIIRHRFAMDGNYWNGLWSDWVSNQWRSPIFYDYNDTSYYCNPNGYSSMYSMRLWGNELFISGGSPTIYFTDVDQQSAMLHNNSNLFYILRGGVNTTSWSTVGSGNWPMVVNLTNNDVTWGGTVNAIYNVVAYASDKRLKENVVEIPNAIDKIKQIRGVTFDWNDGAENLGFKPETKYNDLGVIAQEIQAVLPQAVKPAPFDQWVADPNETYSDEYLAEKTGTSKSGENYLTVQLEKLVPLLIEGIKEQQNQIDELRTELQLLRGTK
jgi:hypothetical protein